MQRLRTFLIFGMLAFVLGGVHGAAAKRIALVIGNDAYEALPNLERAVADARSVAAALEEIGFDVSLAENLTRRGTNRRLAEFEAAIAPGDIVFFFFAGHGVALSGQNLLVPIDMPRPGVGQASLVRDEAHSVDDLVARFQSRGATATLLILDACRDNPFAATGVRSIGGTRGLARMDTQTGVFILFSAGIGQTALDRLPSGDTSPNSVFTRKLVPLLTTPGLSHIDLAKRVQEDVSALAGSVAHPQQPAYYDQIIGHVVLLPDEETNALATASPAPPLSAAAQAWATIQNSESSAVLRAFIREFPDSVYTTFAEARLAEIEGPEIVVEAPSEEPDPHMVSGAEDRRNEQELAALSVEPANDFAGRRAIYYYQRTEGKQGEASEATTVWEHFAKDGHLALRAKVSIPRRNARVVVTISKNHDASLPASHLVEVEFSGELGDSPVQRVPALVLKRTEQERGQPLAGAAVPVTDELFWIALSDEEDRVAHNVQLLQKGSWFDMAILFKDQTRGLITFQKGVAGDDLFEIVMASWR